MYVQQVKVANIEADILTKSQADYPFLVQLVWQWMATYFHKKEMTQFAYQTTYAPVAILQRYNKYINISRYWNSQYIKIVVYDMHV